MLNRNQIIFFLMLFLLSSYHLFSEDNNWRGWRGLERQGRCLSTEIPTYWSKDKNIKWVLNPPGDGYSSPIIFDNDVFITAAYESVKGYRMKISADIIILTLTLFAIVLGTRFIVANSAVGLGGISSIYYILRIIIFGTMLLWLVLFVLFAESGLDYSRCDARGWLGSGIQIGLYSLLATFGLPSRSILRLTMGIFLNVFAVFLFVAIPYQNHIFRYGLWSRNTLITYTITGTIILLGVYSVSRFIFNIKAKRFKRSIHDMANTYSSSDRQLSRLSLAIFAIIFLFTSSVIFSVKVVRSSRDLSHIIGNPKIEPILGWNSLFLLAIVATLVLLIFTSKMVVNKGNLVGSLTPVFRLMLIGSALLTFLDTNYLSTSTEFLRAIISINKLNGKINWVCEGLAGPQEQTSFNSPATPTPATDGKWIIAYFGSAGLMCSDSKGRLVWENRDLKYESFYGVGVSPILYDKYIVIVSDSPEAPYITALDCATGQRIWKKERRSSKQYENSNWSPSGCSRTPIVKKIKGRITVLVWGWEDIKGYELSSGTELWRFQIRRKRGDMVASLVSDEKQLYLSSLEEITALDLEKLGSDENPVAWRLELDGPNIPTPVLYNDLLFVVNEDGYIYCINTMAGKVLWENQLKGSEYLPSPVAAGNNIYFCDNEGLTTVVAAETKYRKIADNDLSEKIFASFAPSARELIIRTDEHLYCVH